MIKYLQAQTKEWITTKVTTVLMCPLGTNIFCLIVWTWTEKRRKGQTISTKWSETGSSKGFSRSLSCSKMISCHSVMLAHNATRQQCNASENTVKKCGYGKRSKLSQLHRYRNFSLFDRDHKQKEVFQFLQYLIMWKGACTNHKCNGCSWLNAPFIFCLPQSWRPKQ